MSDDNKFTKDNVYADKQIEIFNNILTILDMQPNDGKKIKKPDLDNKLEEIEKLFDDIKKYYQATVWRSTKTTTNKGTSIIRCILKKHNCKLSYKYVVAIINNKRSSIQEYFIESL